MADVVSAAEADECTSHGLYRIVGCVEAIRSAKVDAQAVPRIRSQRGAIVRLDAAGGFAPRSLALGRPMVEETARRLGIGVLLINNCYHFSALWADVEPLARRGLVVFACSVGAYFVAFGGWHAASVRNESDCIRFPRRRGEGSLHL